MTNFRAGASTPRRNPIETFQPLEEPTAERSFYVR
jgi:hypothetical protein